MLVKGIIAEDFSNYKLPSMFINTCYCDFKCCLEAGVNVSVCQNSALAQAEAKDISEFSIFWQYIQNPITKAVVIGGMEPFKQTCDIVALVCAFRAKGCMDDFVIYTGYYRGEIPHAIDCLSQFENIIVKFGRYIPNRPTQYDEVLGITLASDNQYAERIS